MIKELMCESCPNGCKLHVDSSNGSSKVSGNFCQQGVAYAYRILKERFPMPFHAERGFLSTSEIKEICENLGVELVKVHPGIPIIGSPERTLFRTVLSADSGERFILEEVDEKRISRKEIIAGTIDSCREKLPVIPYLRGKNGKAVQGWNGRFWMIHRYEEHINLKRDSFWKEKWRGEAVADILGVLHTMKSTSEEAPFSVESYVKKLFSDITREHPILAEEIKPVVSLLERSLFPVLSALPVALCHGDAHPLNMLWGERGIRALIDWEFSGIKPRIYDLALIAGCVGTEDETALNEGFITAMIHCVREQCVLTESEWELFPYMVLALRFNWLSEWMRRKDEEMISFELFYMQHIRTFFNLD